MESTPNHKRTTAIDSAAPEAFRTNHPYLPTNPRLSGSKIIEAKNPNSNSFITLRVFIRFDCVYERSLYTCPGLPCRKHNWIGPKLTQQWSIFIFSQFSHFLIHPLWNILATRAQQTYQGVENIVSQLCHLWPCESFGGSSRVKLHFLSCSSFTAPSYSQPSRGLLVATGVSVSAVRR